MSEWTEASLRSLIAALEKEGAELNRRAAECYWDATMHPTADNARRLSAARADVLKWAANPDVFAKLKGCREHLRIDDPILGRQLEAMYRGRLANQLTETEIQERVQRETELSNLFSSFRAELDGKRVPENEIRRILLEETDSDLRRRAWEASKQIGAAAAPKIRALARLRNAIARRLGFRHFQAMQLWLQEIDAAELDQTLGHLRQLTDGPFQRMKARLDADLSARFGVAPDDLMPWHYSDPFFQELPKASGLDLDAFFRGKDTVKLAADFYREAGMPVEDILARSDLYEREGKYQHAYCIHIDRGDDIRICCNMRDNEYWMTTILHELGHAVYDKYLDPALPYTLRSPAHTLTTEAIAMLMGRLTKQADWLRAWAGISAADAARVEAEVGTRLAHSMLVFVRWGLVMYHFERELYRDPEQDLDALWWRLVADLQGLKVPPGRPAPDWAAKIHIATHPVYYHNYILGELTASQFTAALVRETGRGVTGNPQAGPWLIEQIFRPGARWPWNDLIRHATGEPLHPRHFVEQFVGAG